MKIIEMQEFLDNATSEELQDYSLNLIDFILDIKIVLDKHHDKLILDEIDAEHIHVIELMNGRLERKAKSIYGVYETQIEQEKYKKERGE